MKPGIISGSFEIINRLGVSSRWWKEATRSVGSQKSSFSMAREVAPSTPKTFHTPNLLQLLQPLLKCPSLHTFPPWENLLLLSELKDLRSPALRNPL
jgi:hypothetical protein